MPSIKSGRFITAVYKVEEEEVDEWGQEAFDSRVNGIIKLVFAEGEAGRDVCLEDDNLIDIEIHSRSFGIKESGKCYWTLFETWDEAKAAFDKIV